MATLAECVLFHISLSALLVATQAASVAPHLLRRCLPFPSFFLVIFGGIISVITVLSLVYDEQFTRVDFVFSRSVAWWIAILGTCSEYPAYLSS